MLNDTCKSCTAFDKVEVVGKYKGLCQTCLSLQKRTDSSDARKSLSSEIKLAFAAAICFVGFSVLFYFMGDVSGVNGSRWTVPFRILTQLFGESATYVSMAVMAVAATVWGCVSIYRVHKIDD